MKKVSAKQFFIGKSQGKVANERWFNFLFKQIFISKNYWDSIL